MNLRTPRWWYRREPRRPWWAPALKPLAAVWAAQTARRIARAHPVDSGAPVICIGNLTVGGVGKTPVVRALASRLQPHAHILSRGHGGALAGPVRVDPARHAASDVGDEPLMMAADCPVWVSRDRAAGARAAADAGASVIIMDDGHQNPSLRKALSLVVVDGETRDGEWPFGDGQVFPLGPLREPLAAGLARADAVILLLPAGLAAADPALLALFGDRPVLIARLENPPPPPGRQIAFAGVGKPWKVERALVAAGCELAEFVPFPDHAPYDEVTLRDLARRAQAAKAGLLTTEKDWMRLPPLWRERIACWPLRVTFDDEPALMRLLAAAIPGLSVP